MNLQLIEKKNSILNKFKRVNRFNILFICSGNIIRSPYAHLLFEYLLQEKSHLNKKIHVSSGGVIYRNYSISFESQEMLLREGVSIEAITKFNPRYYLDYPEMFQDVDLVLVMERKHIRRVPDIVRDQTFLLLEFALGISEDVPDPYFDPPFDHSFQMIKDALIRLLEFFS